MIQPVKQAIVLRVLEQALEAAGVAFTDDDAPGVKLLGKKPKSSRAGRLDDSKKSG